MQYVIAFLEGIITFISPCLLPMLPVYISYFAGSSEESSTGRTLKNALGFVLGFTIVFVVLGALAGTVGGFLREYGTAVNIVTGVIVVFFGLYFWGIFRLNIFRGMKGFDRKELGFFSTMLFGLVFSVSWTPCVGAFLGSALMLASQQGLGIPFVVSALLIDRLKTAFDFIKRHYRVINIVCGLLLIGVGVLMMTGLLGRALNLLG